jgi:nitroimidazol reductase NimA-like FMN-containing flavoprotein (pyridoxamine 5'-phosphate oxidase superfamily)
MLIPRELPVDECLNRLASKAIGRLAVATPLGPRIYPVNYVVDGESVVFRTNPYGTLGTFGRGMDVAFEVDHIDEAVRHGWSVMLLGRGELISSTEIRELARGRGLTSWAGGDKSLYVRLVWRHMTGREVGWGVDSDPMDLLLQLRPTTSP